MRIWILASCTTALVGCSGSLLRASLLQPDEQACVERALRGGAGHADLADVMATFERGCRRGDAGACSALGVVYDVGGDVPRDPQRAAELFERACAQANDRGCVNLGRLLVRGDGVVAAPARAERLFSAACETGEPSGCAQLGRLMHRSTEATMRPAYVREVLERACQGREHQACLDLGDVLAETAQTDKALAAYAQACVGGEEEACRRMRAGMSREVGDAAAGWRSR